MDDTFFIGIFILALLGLGAWLYLLLFNFKARGKSFKKYFISRSRLLWTLGYSIQFIASVAVIVGCSGHWAGGGLIWTRLTLFAAECAIYGRAFLNAKFSVRVYYDSHCLHWPRHGTLLSMLNTILTTAFFPVTNARIQECRFAAACLIYSLGHIPAIVLMSRKAWTQFRDKDGLKGGLGLTFWIWTVVNIASDLASFGGGIGGAVQTLQFHSNSPRRGIIVAGFSSEFARSWIWHSYVLLKSLPQDSSEGMRQALTGIHDSAYPERDFISIDGGNKSETSLTCTKAYAV